MIETTNSGLNTLERYNVGLKKEMEALMFSTDVYAMNVNNALAKVQEAVKKCQAEDVEKCSFEGDLSTIKQEKALKQGIPQNERDEAILSLTSHLKTPQKKLQGWADWANEKVIQATQRLGKD
ncbi:hypothetical protein H5410_048020 [Solanum commersonii]|uniref:Uncharacterized protein n=1 Tax=Solanum commersonii TaxID=4109 RepID=A0A9J5XIR7_SOLCO|nr:hypothetical protein H5410_048020 [Solanum commersonii]